MSLKLLNDIWKIPVSITQSRTQFINTTLPLATLFTYKFVHHIWRDFNLGVIMCLLDCIVLRVSKVNVCCRYIKVRYLKLCEAMLVAFLTASAGAASIYFLDDYCHEDTEESLKFAVQVRQVLSCKKWVTLNSFKWVVSLITQGTQPMFCNLLCLISQVFCPKGTYNELSSFWFQRAEDTLRSLFHDPKGDNFYRLFILPFNINSIKERAGIVVDCVL